MLAHSELLLGAVISHGKKAWLSSQCRLGLILKPLTISWEGMAIFTPAVVTVDRWTHVGKVSPPSISPETWGRLFEVCGVAYMLGQEQLSRNK